MAAGGATKVDDLMNAQVTLLVNDDEAFVPVYFHFNLILNSRSLLY